MRHLLFPLGVIALVGILYPLAGRRTDSDWQRLQGTWEVVSAEGQGTDPVRDRGKRLAFDGDLIRFSGVGVGVDASFKLYPDRSPPWIDITNRMAKRTTPGIYRLEGDRLTVCLGNPASARPTEFRVQSGSGGEYQFIYERVRP
jgi:uncharacterized protein (TIGR03067 family)